MARFQISFKQRLRIYLRDQFTCVYCRLPLNPLSDELTIDHIKPNFSNEDSNLATCCSKCNTSKGNMSAEEYMARVLRRKEEEMEKNKIINNIPSELNIKKIIDAIAKSQSVTYEKIIGKTRKANVVKARIMVIEELRKSGLTLKEIGTLLGNRDHTTILHHLNKNT